MHRYMPDYNETQLSDEEICSKFSHSAYFHVLQYSANQAKVSLKLCETYGQEVCEEKGSV